MKILIVGNSISVAGIIADLRKEDQTSQITLFVTENLLPYNRSLLPYLVAGKMKEAQMHTLPLTFFTEHKVDVVAGEKLDRISLKRRHLVTEKKTQISYDQLIIVDTGEFIFPVVKGHQKSGVFDAFRLSSIKELVKFALHIDSVVMPVTNLQGLNIACALNVIKKEVTLLSSTAHLLPDIFDEETGLLLKQILEAKGIRVITENGLAEILGDGQVKAVKLSSGKIMAADMVVFDKIEVDLRMLSENALPSGDRLEIEAYFRDFAFPVEASQFGLGLLDGFCAGITKLTQGGREYMKFDGPQNIYKKIYIHDDSLFGLVLFNAPASKDVLMPILTGRQNINGKEEELLSV